MRELRTVKPLNNFVLDCEFSNGVFKKVDLKSLLDKEAFKPLCAEGNFMKVVNKNYFTVAPFNGFKQHVFLYSPKPLASILRPNFTALYGQTS